jgi:Fic family protein
VLIKAGLAHAQFETIHPFLDGNGRLGRLFISLWLFEQDLLAEPILYLSLYLKTHRAQYYQLLPETRTTGNWEAWLRFFLQGVYETATQAYHDGKQLLAIITEDRGKLAQLGRSAATANQALDALQQSPYITAQALASQLQVSITTANKALDNLHALGIVSEVTGYRRNRVFAYTRVMSILTVGTDPL